MDQQRDAHRRRRPQADRIEPTLPLDMPRAEKPEPRPVTGRRARPAPPPTEDLFGPDPSCWSDPASAPVSGPEPRPDLKPDPGADPGPDPGPEPEPAPPSDPAPSEPPAPPDGPVAIDHGAVLLHPDEVLLQRVDARSFKPNERADSWLYWLTDRDRAQDALRDGVPVEPDETPLLLDRPQVLPRLAVLAEDPDFTPSTVAVLRLKRIAVELFLRAGPEPACYVLSGERKVSA